METFEIFPWNKNFETGISEIDEQHIQLVALLNDVAAHVANRANPIQLDEVFTRLTDYADYHFKSEEEIWQAHFKDDSWLTEHERTHHAFIEKVSALKNDEQSKPLDMLIQDILSFLSQWLAYHILDNDKRMAKVVLAVQSGKSLGQAKKQAETEMSGSMQILIETVLMMYDSLSTRTLELMREKSLRKEAEKELAASEERWKIVLEGSGDGIWDWDINNDAMYLSEGGPSILDLTGRSQDETGKAKSPAIHPEDILRAKTDLHAHLDGKTEMFINEHRILHEDGNWSWVLTRGKVVSRDEQGKALRMVGTHTDITEREIATIVFKNSSEAIFVTDIDNNIISINPAFTEITGYTKDDVAAGLSKWIDLIHPDDRALFNEAIERIIVTKEHDHLQYRIKKKDGNYLDVECFGQFIEKSQEKTARMIGFVEDITDRKQAEEERIQLEQQLVQSRKMEAVGQLTGGIAHDFNNILASVLGFSQLARDKILDMGDDKLERYLKEVIKAGERGSKLVDEMLLFSRTGAMTETITSVINDVNDIVQDSVGFLKGMLPSSIEISMTCGKEIPSIQIDPIHLEQMLMNLCINAMHAMHEEGALNIEVQKLHVEKGQGGIPSAISGNKGERIDVCFCYEEHSQHHTGDYVEISVRDTGSGISSEKLEHIFEPFYTTKEVGKGTGMGLSTLHGIMQGAKGHIIVETVEGKGTLFRLLFKACESTTTGESTTAAEVEISISRVCGRVLLVDDEEAILDFTEEVLSNNGYEVIKSVNGEEALSLFQEGPEKIDLVITDQTMPKLTGVNLSKKLLEIRPDIPIILCTGYSKLVDEEKAKAVGIRSYLKKPIDTNQLLKTINELIPVVA
jgi:hemerythrin-like metal-binding protein/PAS domain S-box-containing protein